MGVSADYQIDVADCKVQLPETLLHMAEQSAVAGVDQHPFGPVNEIGIAVVGSHGLPYKGMKLVECFHGGGPCMKLHFNNQKR
jgi:hypothetical protein